MNSTSYIRAATLGGLISSIFTVTLVLGFQAVADQDSSTDSVPRLVPYNGTLSFDGVPMTLTGDDAPWLRFDIFDNDPTGTQDPEVPVYSQSMLVDVYAGKFTAMLGPSDDNGVSILEIVSDADSLALKITILGDHDENNPESTAADDVTLSNTQRLVFSPFAMWATNATYFNVANTLTANTVFVEGSVSSNEGDVTVSDNLAVEDGNLILGINSILGTDSSITSTGDTVTIDDKLQINNEISSSTDTITINDKLEVGGEISSTVGTVTINDAIYLSGNISSTNGDVTVNDGLEVNGNISSTNGDVTVNDDFHVTGEISGKVNGTFQIVRRGASVDSSTIGNNGARWTQACESGEVAISCGMSQASLGSGNPDSLGCWVEENLSGCSFWVSTQSTADGDHAGHCVCLKGARATF